nr:MAG TPA: hypothetical protein [Caudoviricetes sp.]
MQILNKSQRIYTIQVGKESKRLAPLTAATVADDYGKKLIELYPDELVDISITEEEEQHEEPQKPKAKKKA